MTNIRIPVDPVMPDASVFGGQHANRRAFLRGAASLGLAVGGVGITGRRVDAQEHDHGSGTPEATTSNTTYVGSDASTSDSTGAATPDPASVTPFTVYDPVLQPVQPGPKEFTIVSKDATLNVAKDVIYAGWTFDGTVPGRPLRVVEGDTVTLTVRNESQWAHSLDTHAAKTPPGTNYKNLQPGEEFTWSFVANVPGAYMYHCGTPPVLLHIGAGMYGAMIVDPKVGWSAAQELILVQSEFYFEPGEGAVKVPSLSKMMLNGFMDHVVFNGHASQYVDNPIPIKVGEPVRIFLVNAGPNVWSSFHVVGAIFDRAYVNGNPNNELFGLQSISVGPGDGACVEFTVEEPGTYIAVNHSFGHAAHGGIALLQAE